MISDAKQKQFEVILIYSSSRFARNLEDSIVYRSMLERECGVDVISITQPFVDKKTDMLTNAIYAVMDEWYSMDLSQNVKRGMSEKATRGETQGSIPYGYKIVETKKPPVIVEKEAEVVKMIFSRFIDKKSFLRIARELNENDIHTRANNMWTRKRVEYILTNPFYIGKIYWNKRNRQKKLNPQSEWIVSDGLHEAIISTEDFENVQNIIKTSNTKKYEKPFGVRKHWLSGMLKCKYCGGTLTKNTTCINGKTKHFFRCSGFTKGICKNYNSISQGDAVNNLLNSISNVINGTEKLSYSRLQRKEKNNAELIDQYNKQLEKIEKRLLRAKEAYLNEIDTLEEYNEMKKSIQNQKSEVIKKIESLKSNKIDKQAIEDFVVNLAGVYALLSDDKISDEEKSYFVKTIVDHIVWDRKSLTYEIFYAF